MHNPFPYSNDNKRYRTFHYSLREAFGCKVVKLALDGGFTCPNIDGSKGTGGCVYCSARGSGDFAGNPALSIWEQFQQQCETMNRKWPDAKYLAYFQAHSGTYAPVERLRSLYEEALSCPNVVGLCVATRADLLEEDVLSYLQELNQRTFLLVELGLQTMHDETAKRINRCHTLKEFLSGYELLQKNQIRTCVHLINWLPGETADMMLDSARLVSNLNPHSVKLHMLHLLRGTALGEQFRQEPFFLPDLQQYICLVCDQLELLRPEITIQRLTGDAPAGDLIAPEWLADKRRVLNGIDQELVRRNSWQGAGF